MIDEKSIKPIRLFQALQEQDIRDLLPLLKPLSIPKGEFILREESYGDTISILVQGKVRVTKDLVKGFDEDLASTQK